MDCPICQMILRGDIVDSKDGICLVEWHYRLMAVNREHAPLDLVGVYPVVAELFGFGFKLSVDKVFVSVEEISGHGGVTLIQTIFD